MAHRALLAYERDDGHFDLHRSRWGGANFALVGRITRATPFAGETAVAVNADPLATDLTLDEIAADHLDFLHHEAFYRVTADFETTPFHVCWFGLELDSERVAESETVGHGALIAAREMPDANADAEYLRGWIRGTKSVVADALDRGWFAREEAIEYLDGRLTAWAGDREVIRPEK